VSSDRVAVVFDRDAGQRVVAGDFDDLALGGDADEWFVFDTIDEVVNHRGRDLARTHDQCDAMPGRRKRDGGLTGRIGAADHNDGFAGADAVLGVE
jgi:hypothetical protein